MPDTAEAIVHCMQRSRRLLVVLSPAYLQPQSHSLLECHLGLYLHQTRQAQLVTIRYRSLSSLGAPCGEATQLRRFSSSTVSWRGERSVPPNSRFWKLLRLALPVRPLALGKRLIDSSSTHSDLAVLARLGQQVAPNAQSRSNNRGQRRAGRSRGVRRKSQLRSESRWRQRQLGANESCTVCVSFMESRAPLGGAVEPTWKTHLHQPTANGMPALPAVSCPLTIVDSSSQEQSPQPSNGDQDNNNINNSQICELQSGTC